MLVPPAHLQCSSNSLFDVVVLLLDPLTPLKSTMFVDLGSMSLCSRLEKPLNIQVKPFEEHIRACPTSMRPLAQYLYSMHPIFVDPISNLQRLLRHQCSLQLPKTLPSNAALKTLMQRLSLRLPHNLRSFLCSRRTNTIYASKRELHNCIVQTANLTSNRYSCNLYGQHVITFKNFRVVTLASGSTSPLHEMVPANVLDGLPVNRALRVPDPALRVLNSNLTLRGSYPTFRWGIHLCERRAESSGWRAEK